VDPSNAMLVVKIFLPNLTSCCKYWASFVIAIVYLCPFHISHFRHKKLHIRHPETVSKEVDIESSMNAEIPIDYINTEKIKPQHHVVDKLGSSFYEIGDVFVVQILDHKL
jgi:hypothetical protein